MMILPNLGAQCKIFNSLAVRSSYLSGNKNGSHCMVLSYNKREETDFSKKAYCLECYNITMLNDSENIALDIQSGQLKKQFTLVPRYLGNEKKCNFWI
jgi:hypothetical protein